MPCPGGALVHGCGARPCAAALVRNVAYLWHNHRGAVVATLVGVVAYKAYKVCQQSRRRKKWDSAGKDVVVVHTIGRATNVPSLSPFVLKLETYLRMASIKYEVCTEVPMGSKGKLPWITINGRDLTDSQLIQEFLANKFGKDFSANHTNEQRAVGKAFQVMADEHLFWGLVWWRIVKDPDYRFLRNMNFGKMGAFIYVHMIRCRIAKMLWAQGLGRHSDAEVVSMMQKDLEAFSLYLGDKKFLMGDDPSEVDCAVFGIVAQCVWAAQGSPFAAMMQSDYRNLLQYALRMREKFFPDWDEILLTPLA